MSVDKISFSSSNSNKRVYGAPSHANNEWRSYTTKMLQEDDKFIKNDKPEVGCNKAVGHSNIAFSGLHVKKINLGSKLQRMFGGIKKAFKKNVGEPNVEIIISKDVVGKAACFEHIKPAKFERQITRLDLGIQKEIEGINLIIDRNIPKVEKIDKKIKIYTKEDCMDIIGKEIDLKTIDFSKCFRSIDGTLCYVKTEGKYKYVVEFNPVDKSVVSFRKTNSIRYDDAIEIKFGEGKKVDYTNRLTTESCLISKDGYPLCVSKHTSPEQTVFYDQHGNISHVSNHICDNKGNVKLMPGNSYMPLESTHVHYRGGKISEIDYFDKTSGSLIKTEFVKNDKVVAEEYVIDGKPVKVEKFSLF